MGPLFTIAGLTTRPPFSPATSRTSREPGFTIAQGSNPAQVARATADRLAAPAGHDARPDHGQSGLYTLSAAAATDGSQAAALPSWVPTVDSQASPPSSRRPTGPASSRTSAAPSAPARRRPASMRPSPRSGQTRASSSEPSAPCRRSSDTMTAQTFTGSRTSSELRDEAQTTPRSEPDGLERASSSVVTIADKVGRRPRRLTLPEATDRLSRLSDR